MSGSQVGGSHCFATTARSALILFMILPWSIDPSLADGCETLSAGLRSLDLSKGTELTATGSGKTYKKLFDECDATNRFSGQPLPNNRRCSTDKNRVEFLKRFPDGTIVFKAKMAVDADGSPASQGPNHSPTDQPVTWLTFDVGSVTHFVNAEEVSFAVVPLPFQAGGISFLRDSGLSKGDLALIARESSCSLGVVGDAGPYFRIGEGSIRAHEDLGNRQCAVPGQHPCMRLKGGGSGIGIAAGVTFVLFPGTRPQPLLSQTVSGVAQAETAARAQAFFAAFRR